MNVAPLLEESAEDLYEHAPCGYLSTLPGGRIVKVNETFLRWTGYTREELVDVRRIQELLAPGDRIFYETHYAPLLQMQGAVREIAVEILRADGSRLPALVNSVLRQEGPGLSSVIRTTVFDATERRRYEQELMRARREADVRARAAAALENVVEGVLVVDAEGRIALTNTAARSILGITETATGLPAAEAIDGWEALSGSIPVGTPESSPAPHRVPRRHQGREQWLTIAGIDSGDDVVYTLRDVTGERELELLREEVIHVVSHELRTPLAGVYGAAVTLLAVETLSDQHRRELLEMVVSQSERLRSIVDRILLSRRLSVEDIDFAREPFDLADVARVAAIEVAEAHGAGARLKLAASSETIVRGDAGYARQAIGNLVDNAFKYSHEGTGVRVTVSSDGARGRVEVADQGPGVPPAQRDRIFERFYRSDPGLSRGVGGTGLGLYIARELVAGMGGAIGHEPTGDGASFVIELPLTDGAPVR